MVCRSGGRSGQVVAFLKDRGFDNVRNLDGGMFAWAGNRTQPGGLYRVRATGRRGGGRGLGHARQANAAGAQRLRP